MTLHLVTTRAGYLSCIRRAGRDDTIVLLQSGVLVAADAGTRDRALCAVADDVAARGLASRLAADVTQIDWSELVDLVVTHAPVVTWAR